jgi:hypothetical protein
MVFLTFGIDRYILAIMPFVVIAAADFTIEFYTIQKQKIKIIKKTKKSLN